MSHKRKSWKQHVTDFSNEYLTVDIFLKDKVRNEEVGEDSSHSTAETGTYQGKKTGHNVQMDDDRLLKQSCIGRRTLKVAETEKELD